MILDHTNFLRQLMVSYLDDPFEVPFSEDWLQVNFNHHRLLVHPNYFFLPTFACGTCFFALLPHSLVEMMAAMH